MKKEWTDDRQIYLFSICGNNTTAISLRSKQWYHNTPEDGET